MAPTPIDQSRQLRTALGSFPTGVTIVTTSDALAGDVGLTANSFSSVSLDPPLVLWSLSRNSGSRPAFEGAGYFAVHILAAQQEALAARFAQRGVERFAGLRLERGHGNTPLIDGCSARFECRALHHYEGGDHLIIVGEVLKFEHFERPALAFHGGKYALSLKKAADPKAIAVNPENGELTLDLNGLNMLLGIAYRHIRHKLEPLLHNFGLTEHDYWILHMVGIEGGRKVALLDHLLRFTGSGATTARCIGLADRGYLSVEGDGGEARTQLAPVGRQALMAMSAATKSAEIAAEAGLDFAEAQMLRQLLRRLISDMQTPEGG
jgi:3-hydroxy-9,10-secoandrosta-1,3,5(10)-triene-9,17-dione monooxygenase reductase component